MKSSVIDIISGIWKDRGILTELAYKDFERKAHEAECNLFKGVRNDG